MVIGSEVTLDENEECECVVAGVWDVVAAALLGVGEM